MPGKKMTPAPIDRPLSRAYLREFSGWSTAFPPGISEPTSLRVMENLLVNRDGSVRVRPGMRYVSYGSAPGPLLPGTAMGLECVGTHEPFFLADGSKAYLFAVRETDGTVGFRALQGTPGGDMVVRELTDPGVDFVVTGSINFSSATRYVKYLQIDNRIFALSDAGETMRYFTVGENKSAKKLASVTRPEWSVDDKLAVVHPDAAWITSASAITWRRNRVPSPSFAYGFGNWVGSARAWMDRGVALPGYARSGARSLRLGSLPARTNFCTCPALDTAVHGLGGWSKGSDVSGIGIASNGVQGTWAAGTGVAGLKRYLDTEPFATLPGGTLRIRYELRSIGVNTSDSGVLIRFYNASGVRTGSDVVRLLGGTTGGKDTTVSVPANAMTMTLHPFAVSSNTGGGQFIVGAFMVCDVAEDPSYFDGDSGTDFLWAGTPGRSYSMYHPPADVSVTGTASVVPGPWCLSAYVRAGTTVRDIELDLSLSGSGSPATNTSVAPDTTGGFTRQSVSTSGPAGTTGAEYTITVRNVPRGEFHYVDDVMLEEGTTPDVYFDGDTPNTASETYAWEGTVGNSDSLQQTFTSGGSVPPAETKTANTLISSTAANNVYNFGFFYTFSTEIGESAASQVTVVRAQRGWQQWRWETPNASGEPSGTSTNDGDKACDQLAAYMPQEVYDQAVAQGAVAWNLYAFTWSDQDPVPVTAVRVGSRQIDTTKPYTPNSWLRMTPMMADAGSQSAPLPTRDTRRNYTEPSRAGQGLVAADRMIMVYDPASAAVIRWTGNQQGAYTDFTAGRGGGYKTLTSGNLYVPACVKLWQNPQSVDTLTILCLGVDGQSAGYYMAPSQVAAQSSAVNIMGFEETTATPGTVSPFGVEVMNNALYHPLDEQLMKSTATNYNINHSSITDQIQDRWRALSHKDWIVSSQHDNRIYYLVLNPDGETLLPGCRGNEVWVFDGAQKAGTWSRWLVQGVSLRKIEFLGQVGMSVVRPDGIYFFDERYDQDDVVLDGVISHEYIPWKLETNTQGANRAHDAWAHLQQANLVVGNFTGQLRYGVRGLDIHGTAVDISKITRDPGPGQLEAFDLEDFLLIQRDMKEWFFYASSVADEDGRTKQSQGQLNLVQYRYTPSTVNTGYEFGSVETFEYQRAGNPAADRTTDNGVPMPYVDTRRP